jgi:S1-C subfamily serine protease
VVGVNTAIASPSGHFTGVSFAIPINKARPLLLKAIDG